jgi:hypothetical protein
MQDKQKVTLYLPPELHRHLKIQSAVESEPMSALVERAVVFYLEHPEIVESMTGNCGQTHRVYNCPSCESPTVIRDGELVGLSHQSSLIETESLSIERARSLPAKSDSQGEEELVPC